MGERILIITDKQKDMEVFEDILGPKGFAIERVSLFEQIEKKIMDLAYDAIMADYDLAGERAHHWIGLLQEIRSKACFILYGEDIKAEKISEILQKGAYGFIPRALLPERVYDTIVGGLENRKAFIEILGMIDRLREVNERLKGEKEALRTKNEELGFISQLSREVAYDLNWDRILPRVLHAGLPKVIDHELLCILYRLGSRWNMAVHLSEKEINKETLEKLKEDISKKFYSLSRERISGKEIALQLHPSNNVRLSSSSSPISFSEEWILSMSLAGKPLGMLAILPKNKEACRNGKQELMSTIANILAISLKNAQEYHRLKEMAVTDGLTGIFNHKGLIGFIQREFQRARRYSKSLSLIMIDVDNFKIINDSLGHQAGDYVLRELAGCLRSCVRNSDIVARYGGDEFAILLPETDTGKAEVLVKRMLNTIKGHAFQWGPERIKVEISYGIATVGEVATDEGEEEFIQLADNRLYRAKRSRSVLYPIPGQA